MQKDLHIEAFQIDMLADSVLSCLLTSSLPRFHILLSVSIIALIPTAMDQFIFFEFTIPSPGLSQRLLVILIPFELYSIFLFSPCLFRYFLFSPFFLILAIFSSILSFRANFVQVLIFNWSSKWILRVVARWTRLAQSTKRIDHFGTSCEQISLCFLLIWWTVWDLGRLIVWFYLQLRHLDGLLPLIILNLFLKLLLIQHPLFLFILPGATMHRAFNIIFAHLLAVILAWSFWLLQHINVIKYWILRLKILVIYKNQSIAFVKMEF